MAIVNTDQFHGRQYRYAIFHCLPDLRVGVLWLIGTLSFRTSEPPQLLPLSAGAEMNGRTNPRIRPWPLDGADDVNVRQNMNPNYVRLVYGACVLGTVLLTSCAIDRTISGQPLSELSARLSLTKDMAAGVTKEIRSHKRQGGIFWDGPYRSDEAAQITRLDGEKKEEFEAFSLSHKQGQFFVCFESDMLYVDFASKSGIRTEKVYAYVPMAILYRSAEGEFTWYSI